MPKIVVVGGGWAGCAAAIAAAKTGADVVLLERTDMFLGTGLVGGIMRNNGRFTATEEMLALGGGDLFEVTDAVSRHKNIEFPGHKHASLYDVAKVEPAVKERMNQYGNIEYRTEARVRDVQMEGSRITAVVLEETDVIQGDSFVDASGTAGPQGNCTKYGNGCAMCVYRCPTFGGRVSIAAKAGVKEIIGRKADGSLGAMSGSCKLHKDSIRHDIIEEMDRTGVAIIPIPEKLRKADSLSQKACQQYALKEFADNVIILDTGHAKLMSPFYPLDKLRQVPGFEDARFEDPYSGGIGNSVRYLGMCPRDNTLKVQGNVDNLFCAGEKAGLLVGHTEAIVTGTLAGHNAARAAVKKELLEIPQELAVGDAIAHVKEQMGTEDGLTKKYTFSGSVYFQRMKEKNLYTTDVNAIQQKVQTAGLSGVFAQPLS
ncbi:FAD-dependent oxidoreductase [Heliorestis acidaminivorans]|uniref:FAD-dependent oxidoreductase n=1 Tax=Heliorestis acidaminivorans TaxID=553427 RepID=A0A6I0F270_9FIRM|nr:FAD-dependent oxidoreductase [Heliorestis acidaminivorans]KAB2952346.1 FAD-dependent oxidoreductase [Heliorestis acidaminivorans]